MKARARQRRQSVKAGVIAGPMTKDDAKVRTALGRTGRRGQLLQGERRLHSYDVPWALGRPSHQPPDSGAEPLDGGGLS